LTEKEMRKLNRYQLLELLILQTERADKLQKQLEQLEAQTNDEDMRILRLGSIAEVSLQLSGVYEATQKAADLYFEAAKKQADELVADARKKADQILREAEAQSQYLSVKQRSDDN